MTLSESIGVVCRADGGGWSCVVQVGSGGRATEHTVSVSAAELARLGPGDTEPANLVERSFRFLLEREPKESILPWFALSDIERYFPEYPANIGTAV